MCLHFVRLASFSFLCDLLERCFFFFSSYEKSFRVLELSGKMKALSCGLTAFKGCPPLRCFCKPSQIRSCWRSQLGDQIQFLLHFIFVIFSKFLRGCGPLIHSSLWVPLLILCKFRMVFCLVRFLYSWQGYKFLGTRGGTRSS